MPEREATDEADVEQQEPQVIIAPPLHMTSTTGSN